MLGLWMLAACTRHAAPAPPPVGAPWPDGSARGEVAFELALYPTSEGQEDPVTVLVRRAEAFPRLHHTNAEDASVPAWWAATVDASNYGPSLERPAPALVAHLSALDRARLPQVKRVTFVTFRGAPGDEALLHEGLQLVDGAAEELGALVLDSETGELFAPADLKKLRLDGDPPLTPELARHVVVRVDGARISTAGMGKFGLPDVALEDPRVAKFPDAAHALIDLVCQLLRARTTGSPAGALELPEVPAELQPLLGTSRTVKLRVGARREGDPENRLVALQLPDAR